MNKKLIEFNIIEKFTEVINRYEIEKAKEFITKSKALRLNDRFLRMENKSSKKTYFESVEKHAEKMEL
jgi:hypothetical protein